MNDDTAAVDWSRWTVILLKPDCVRRGLVSEVLQWMRGLVTIVDSHTVIPTEDQVFAHYADMLPLSEQLGRDVPAELRRIFIGNRVVVALGYGENAAERVRAVVGVTDPASAPSTTVRGRYAKDSLDKAVAEGRLVDNLIHTSDHSGVVERDFGIWYGPQRTHLLRPPAARGGAR
ncbi:nucleoside-diphosphate kinase [Micromonospora sp. NPDC004540]|uniref:nucleoside-diphosphate kinase n=1 Tax=Micromonospora sp. NPDC004540 TaxID=3154457 RepID=UPI0033ADAAFB